ncbi:MAG: hypothetical protein JW863_23040 [Chitinispirillaceae bacterium]|nr:hypothetical protein [Chitinispirillaceae bacterium]
MMKLFVSLLIAGSLVSAGAQDSLSVVPESDSGSTVVSESVVAPLPVPYETGSTNLIALSPRQWLQLAESGVIADSLSVAGAAYDPETQQFVLVLLDSGGQPELMPIETPPSLFDKIIHKESASGQSELSVGSVQPQQEDVAPQVALSPAQPGNQDGRTYFIINTTLRATGIYPSALALAMPGTDGRIITGVAMLTFGGALYGSYAATRTMSLGYGKVAMMNYGGELGVYYPALLSFIAGEQGYDKAGQNIYGWGAMLGFPLGIVGASFTRFVDNHEYGNAALMRHFGRIGLVYGFTIPLLWSFNNDFNNYMTVASALSMCFIPAGFYLGKTIVGDRSFSSGRSGLVVISGIMGAATAAIIPSWWESETPELYVGMGLAGSVAGTALGFFYHSPQEYKLWQGVFMGVSATIGAGVGVSIPLLAKAEDHRAYTACGVLGAWGGLFIGERLSKALFENSSRDRRSSSANIEFPIAWEWPSLATAALVRSRGRTEGVLGKACLLRVSF